MGLIVFLILFVLMGSVSATNDNITTLSQDTDNGIIQEKISTGNDDSNLKEIENKEILITNHENTTLKTSVSGDTFADIQTAIDSAASGDTIELDGLYKGSGTSILIDKNNLTIIGNDAILDAQGQSRILNITGNGIILENIKFINGNATDNGGAICGCGANGIINNCNFAYNKATLRGGAIYWDGVNETINNSIFINNTAKKYSGGAVHLDSNSANGAVNNCNFTSNTGTQKGGAIFWCGVNGTVNNSNFINSTSISGGAIFWDSSAFNGAADNCGFISNKGDDGGAIYWFGANGRMNNCNFTNNSGTNGGAINWQRTYGIVNNCNFINNTAESNGGAVYWYAYNGTITNSYFANNTAESNGGAVYWQSTDGNISYSIFKGNTGDYRNIYSSEDLGLFNSTLETFVTINQIPDSYAGNNATVNFTFDDGTNLGGYNVTLYNNNQIIKTFKYEGIFYYNYTWDKLAVGNYSITVGEINTKRNRYIANYEPMNFKVIKKYTTSVVINPIANVTYNSEVVVDFIVENRTDINAIITNVLTCETKTFYNISGSEFRINNLVPGTYNITIINCENEMYASSNASDLFSVLKIFIKNNKDMSVFYREGAKFKVRIVDENGNPVSGKVVTFKVNGVTYSAVSSANGYASCNIDWKPGKSSISTVCEDASALNTIRVKSVIHAAKDVKVAKSKKNTQFKISLYGIKSKIVKKPSFKFNGKTKVSIKIGKDLAGKKVSIKFKGKYFNTKVDSKGNGVLKISKKLACELKLKKSKKYKATATYEDKIIYKNKQVKVKIGGKKYSIKTNKKGVAVFKIAKQMVKKLKVGKKYSYYIEFGENTAKGNLIIKK